MQNNEINKETLKLQAKNHSAYYHYTILDSLLHIIKTKSFRLSRLELLNDTIEATRIDLAKKNKIYTACFCHIEETPPMWLIYANNDYGVKINFDNIAFFENKENYFISERNDFSKEDWEVKIANIIDIHYANNLDEYNEPFAPFEENDPHFPRPILLGALKTKIWDYESETRALCYINLKKGKREFDDNAFVDKPKPNKYLFEEVDFPRRYPAFNHLFCIIPDEILKKMKITFNPFMTDTQKKTVIAAVKNYAPDFDNFQNSELEGKIR